MIHNYQGTQITDSQISRSEDLKILRSKNPKITRSHILEYTDPQIPGSKIPRSPDLQFIGPQIVSPKLIQKVKMPKPPLCDEVAGVQSKLDFLISSVLRSTVWFHSLQSWRNVPTERLVCPLVSFSAQVCPHHAPPIYFFK